MKRTIEIIVCVALSAFVILCFYCKYQSGATATMNDLKRVEQEFNRRLDSILVLTNRNTQDLDTVKAEIRDVKADTDTIKAGQKVLFETMEENKGKSLFEYLFQ